MRTLVVLLAATLFSGCASTVLAEPAVHVSPYLALYQLRGKTKMQSEGLLPPGIVNNPQQELRSFGQDRHREDVGLRADIGDGFGGIRVDYYRLDMDTARSGELEHDWGRLLQGDMVSVYAEMDEVRVGYLEPLVDIHTEYRNEELRLQFAGGGVFATRSMTLHGREGTPGTRAQDLTIDGDVVYLAARARATWKQFAFDLDYAVAPEEFVLSGDMEDFSQDIEARLSYRLPQRDISFFAGMRYSTISASGDANGFNYKNDMTIDGFQLGFTITF
jgi:hypothetical protein